MPDLMESMDQAFNRRAEWQLKFIYWPRRCSLSGGWIWPLSHAYRAMWHSPGTPAMEVQWHDGVEHVVWLLKGHNK